MKLKHNFIGVKFGSLTITNQYLGGDKRTQVDYICDCGTHRIGAHLANVKIQKNCNKCQRRGLVHKAYGESSFNNLYNTYRQNARLKQRSFELTKEEFRTLTKQNCFYCGKSPSRAIKSKKSHGEYIYNGVDRKDNTQGYTVENSVSCCKFCNLTKTNTDFNEFIRWVRAVDENTKHIELE